MKQNNQEKYAEENFSSLDGIMKSIYIKMKDYDKFKQQFKDKTNVDDPVYDDLEQLRHNLELSFTMLSIKFTTTVGHALNSNTTGVLKKLLEFLDTNGLNDSLIQTNMIKTISNKIGSGSFCDMCAIAAMRNKDLQFIKDIEAFFKNNTKRENKYAGYIRKYGEMTGDDMTRFTQIDGIAFEALIIGFKEGYIYFTNSQGLKRDYIMKYIKNKWSLSEQEVAGILSVEPTFLDDLLEFIPDKIPSNVKDIFIF